ncbi:NF-X1-type zinc finger protein nfxl1 [Asimina triloba]
MRPSPEVRQNRRDGSRPSNRPAARQEWIPRGSTTTTTVVVANPHNPPSAAAAESGRESESRPSPNPTANPTPAVNDARQRPKGHYVVKKREAEAPESAAVPQLVQEIQDKLAKGAVECMICYDMVRRSAPIWSCSSCYSIFHLNCIKRWARAPTSSDVAVEKNQGLNWRCPGCQSVQLVAWKEIRYTCFCGRRTDPLSDFYLMPHSCGEPCGKPLDRGPADDNWKADEDENRCSHVCVLQCHPGPCPPCKAFAPQRKCPCGKKTIMRRCSDKSVVTCGQQCNKLLECMRHHCERMCHTGPCYPCQFLINATCFCKKKTEVILCGEMSVKGEVVAIDGLFTCNSVCGKQLSCQHHFCDETCHPGSCGECELLPGRIKSCPCGKSPLVSERQSCLDPIPTCSLVCGKVLQCGVHHCQNTCHEGECEPCLVIVNQKCRCGFTSRFVECYKTVQVKDKFVCEKPCGRKKNCGRHRCSERCCPLSGSSNHLRSEWDPHFCSMTCGKKLRCGQHSCVSLCHSGHCPPCMETIFTDLSCACGQTVIPPPLPCGTPPPSCQQPCAVAQPCGHPSTHSCHFGDCLPCTVPVAKECIGGHVILRNIPCGSKDIRCNQLCGKTRQCGMHACGRTCHPPPCDSSCGSVPSSIGKVSCGQVCGAPRRDCRHTCTAPCHPSSPCPDIRCTFPVTITCSCGRITATIPCDAGGSGGGFHVDTVFEASVIQKLPVPLQPVEANGKKIPLGQRKLVCDEECVKIERKRVLADAFDITPPNLDGLHFGDNSTVSESLADLLRREPKWVLAVEERFKFMVLGKVKGSMANGLRVHVFCAALKEKRDAIRQIAERWKLSVQAAGWEPKRFLVVHVTPKSRAPPRMLGPKGAVAAGMPHPPAFDPLIDMDPRLVVALLDLPRDADISALVLRFGGECELVWLNDRNALAVFSDPARAATALRRLDHGTAYHGAVVVVPTGGAPGSSPVTNVWGGCKDGVSAVKANPWKKAVSQESGWSEDSWGGGDWPNGGSGADATAMGGALKAKEAPLPVTGNRWNLLDPDSNLTGSSSGETPASGHHAGNSSSAAPSRGDTTSAVAREEAGAFQLVSEEVEDWEKAYE